PWNGSLETLSFVREPEKDPGSRGIMNSMVFGNPGGGATLYFPLFFIIKILSSKRTIRKETVCFDQVLINCGKGRDERKNRLFTRRYRRRSSAS
ncbi:MAG: hypothetical protein ACFFEW_15900, partial [Candidatus Thorarchaeota archaeon]